MSLDVRALEEQSDEALARMALDDPSNAAARRAAALLFGRYQRRVYLWCFRYCRNHERALDLAQDVMLSACRNLSSYNGEGRFFSWLFAITRNRCLNALRKPPLLRDEAVDLETLHAPQAGPDEAWVEKLGEETVLKAIRDHLDAREQEAIYLRCFERLPVDEITTMLSITSASGARGLLQSARRKLRAALAKPLRDHRGGGR